MRNLTCQQSHTFVKFTIGLQQIIRHDTVKLDDRFSNVNSCVVIFVAKTAQLSRAFQLG